MGMLESKRRAKRDAGREPVNSRVDECSVLGDRRVVERVEQSRKWYGDENQVDSLWRSLYTSNSPPILE